MNREIKFRAWHKDFGEMVYSNMWDFQKREFTPFLFNVGFSHYPENEDWQIMQFSGIVDKDGKEIYEGDILKYSSDGFKYETGDVIFADGCFRCRCTFFHQLSRTIAPQFQVIGNIFENAEMLMSSPKMI